MIFSVCSFQGTLLTDCLSVIRIQNFFWTLITGKPSVNSTALLMGLAAISCCSSLPVFIFKLRQRICLRSFFFKFGGHLLSHTVSSAVPSAVWVLTIVFGMGTGVTPRRIATKTLEFLARSFRALERSVVLRSRRGPFEPLARRTSFLTLPDNSTIDNSSLLLLPF